ncbi:MAG: ABC transporter ATP-binding protein [Defluviitaleaceae bacterium]|nr:ABC transporter ATP-binding protein [Defluviitaleaceae bacterium]MCL2218059.1 ABC transporter ATP-binding protein [Defluviitaleaceae bacterium]
MTRLIELVDITKVFGKQTVLNHVDLYIRQNEFVTLLGPSGCGKTTTLRIIGGFEQPTGGDVFFNGESMLKTPPHKRKLNTVFQKYALFPNMNVAENIAFGLKIEKVPKNIIQEKVKSMLKLVNLDGFEKRQVTALSGGQQQRVAIARALVNEPQVLLLDEPLGALDLKLRKEMQVELKNMQQKLGITFVYVTHDQEEALTMSDTVAIMNEGKILQIGVPEDIYNEPKNAFVANFIGESNILPGKMLEDFRVEFAGAAFTCVDKGFDKNEPVDIVVRPEDIRLNDKSTPSDGVLKGMVSQVIFKGVHYEMRVETPGISWKVHSTKQSPAGSQVGLSIAPESIHVMKGPSR